MLLGLGESLEGLLGLLAVSYHQSLFYVLAPLLNLLSSFVAFVFFLTSLFTRVLLQCFCTSVVQLPSLVAQIQKLVCDPRLNLLALSPKDLFSR